MAVPDLQLRYLDAETADPLTDQLVAMFAEVWGRPPYAGDPNFSAETFAVRLGEAMKLDGFEVPILANG
ncbi:hypothetical protein Sme01_62530 [Sphaerisporangium melleum]|uniref:Uncharacterized protein n=1 Tax=Sphaerisporangium melleum TaxID=321316 RepID=A0A917R1H9_9ACTN|nr:hypothetical protein [Sphaerisporangium melleum]GGK81981.1 hypothetical protein GCM10007964_25810 [Sphaerisporangium melleum]GII73777.1 hypothetical protein Sme01_62530 [Sphaerisporangium melleum]